MDNSKKIIEAIKNQDIKPTPGWIFTLKKMVAWILFGMTVILGALAFSVILFTIQESDFSLSSHMSHSKLEMFLGLLPVIWLIYVIIFFGLAIVSIRNSWRGYKFSVIKQFGISIGMAVALGTLLFIVGGGNWIEKTYERNVSSYESLEERKQDMWSKPEAGFLSGTIVSVESNSVTISDFKGDEWVIKDLESSFIANAVILEPGEVIKILGEKIDDTTFSAGEIRPWGGRGREAGKNRDQ